MWLRCSVRVAERARGSMEFCHLWPEGSIVGVEFLGKRQLAHCPLPIFLYMKKALLLSSTSPFSQCADK